MRRHLEEFAKYVKLSGSPAERESFRYLEATLQGYGFSTSLISHPAYISLPVNASLEVAGVEVEAITHSFSVSSPEDGFRGPVVYVADGAPEDLENHDVGGKIVVLEGMARPAAALLASKANVAAIIHVSPHEHLHEMCVSPVWGSPGSATFGRLPTTIVVTISKEDGDALKVRLQNTDHVEAVIHAEVDTGWRDTPLLEATLSGRESGASFVLFSGHHDTWHYGVMDNGGANATMLEVARIFSSYRDEMRRELRLCFWSGHSHGRYTGSAWYADSHWSELESRCVAHVNVDSTGGRNNNVLIHAPASVELVELARESVQTQGKQTISGKRVSRAGDQSFWGIGVPSIFMGIGEQSLSGDADASSTLTKGMDLPSFGWWWHTPEDTLDKMDDEVLVRDTRVYVHAIWRLLTDERLPIDPGAQVDQLQAEVKLLGKKISDRFNVTCLLGRIAALQHELESRSLTDRETMALCRELVPLDYTTGDRFVHDPALPQNPYPVLDPLRALAAEGAGSPMIPFLKLDCRRASNRVEAALNNALRILRSGP
ncbi:M28 family peptidase [Mesorhizobium sp. NZP2234]|nr:M28 family peptidase [Mesorhizobium sp. NZP2234]